MAGSIGNAGNVNRSLNPRTQVNTTDTFTPVGLTDSTGGVNANVAAPVAAPPNDASTKSDAATRTKAPEPAPSISRALTPKDIRQTLLNLGKPVTGENQEMLMLMLMHGIEASSENFDQLKRLRSFAKESPHSTESSVIAMAKGLKESPKAVNILNSFLSQNAQLGEKALLLQQQIASFKGGIIQHQELFSKGLFAGLSSVISDLDEQLKKINKKYSKEEQKLSKFDRKSLSQNFQTFLGFVKGLEEKVTSGREDIPALKDAFTSVKQEIGGFLESLLSQAIISKDMEKNQMSLSDRYAYWQVPNPLARGPKTMDILIRKDPAKKKGEIDPAKTRMVMRMQTEDIGELAITMDIQDKKIWYLFQTDRFDTEKHISEIRVDLLKQMEAINYKTMSVKSVRQKVDIKKLLLPTFDLSSMSRVSAEI